MKEYRVRVVEVHSDYVWVKAESREEAEDAAHEHSQCEFESVQECTAVEERDV